MLHYRYTETNFVCFFAIILHFQCTTPANSSSANQHIVNRMSSVLLVISPKAIASSFPSRPSKRFTNTKPPGDGTIQENEAPNLMTMVLTHSQFPLIFPKTLSTWHNNNNTFSSPVVSCPKKFSTDKQCAFSHILARNQREWWMMNRRRRWPSQHSLNSGVATDVMCPAFQGYLQRIKTTSFGRRQRRRLMAAAVLAAYMQAPHPWMYATNGLTVPSFCPTGREKSFCVMFNKSCSGQHETTLAWRLHLLDFARRLGRYLLLLHNCRRKAFYERHLLAGAWERWGSFGFFLIFLLQILSF